MKAKYLLLLALLICCSNPVSTERVTIESNNFIIADTTGSNYSIYKACYQSDTLDCVKVDFTLGWGYKIECEVTYPNGISRVATFYADSTGNGRGKWYTDDNLTYSLEDGGYNYTIECDSVTERYEGVSHGLFRMYLNYIKEKLMDEEEQKKETVEKELKEIMMEQRGYMTRKVTHS